MNCLKCNQTKEKNLMYAVTGYRYCKECIDKEYKTNTENKVKKLCSNCKLEKTWDNFWIGTFQCKECINNKRKTKKEDRKLDETPRKCKNCNLELPSKLFEIKRAICIECNKLKVKEYRSKTKSERNEAMRRYRKNNPKYVEKSKENIKKYRELHKKELQDKEKERLKNDPVFKLKKNLRRQLLKHVKNKHTNSIEILGCSGEFLKEWIEYQFDENMSWSNHGIYWHIDHIKPINSFDITMKEEVNLCFNWRNIQPLEKTKNMEKSDKIIPELIQEKNELAEKFYKLKHN